MIPTLLGISLIVFALTQIVPGGPVDQYMSKLKFGGGGGESGSATVAVSEELKQELNRLYGFDKPIHERYVKWMGDVVRFEFGQSYQYQEPVIDVIASKFPVSLTFGIFTLIAVYSISVPLGVYKAVKDGTRFDAITSVLLFVGYSIPPFSLAILLIVFFCGGSFLDWFPLQGLVSDNFDELTMGGKILDYLHHIVLPLTAFVIGQFALTTMMMKNSFLEQIKQDYVRTARAKGLSPNRIYFKHVLRNALIPIATELGQFTTIFLSGSVLIEQIFGLDGLGQLNFNSILSRDYPVVLALIMIASLAGIIGVIISDFLYVLLDPRIDYD
jgi:microcin C transport system permease protein